MLLSDSVLGCISLLVSVIGYVCIQRVIKKSNNINVIRITKSYCSHVRLIIKLKLGLIIHISQKEIPKLNYSFLDSIIRILLFELRLFINQ